MRTWGKILQSRGVFNGSLAMHPLLSVMLDQLWRKRDAKVRNAKTAITIETLAAVVGGGALMMDRLSGV